MSVSVAPETLQLIVGDDAQLAATVLPTDAADKTVAWSVEPADIVSVDAAGKVTALKAGAATVTATTTDGGFTAHSTLTIKEPAPEIEQKYFSVPEATFVPEAAQPEATIDTSFDQVTISGSTVTLVSPIELEKIFVGVEGTPGYYEIDAASALLTRAVYNYGFDVAVSEQMSESFLISVSGSTADGGVLATSTMRTDKDNAPESVKVESVTLSPTELTLIVGDSATLTATVAPANAYNKNVSFVSSAPSVATVIGGEIRAVGVGVAQITAITEDGALEASCTVTVETIAVESVSLNADQLTLEVGKTGQLAATVWPDDASDSSVSWSSSDESVATVSNGFVRALKAGTATITATTADGGHTASCEVTVENPPTEGTMGTLTWKFEDGTLTIGGEGEIMPVPNGGPEWHDAYHSQITKIVIGDGVTAIGPWMFMQYTALTSVSFGSGLTSIGGNVEGSWDQIGAFQYCSGLTSVSIPGNVTTIMGNAFQDCSSLASITISEGVQTIGQSAFLKTAISSIDIPDSVTTIGAFAFAECPNLTTLTIGSGLTSISRPFTLTPIQTVRIEATTPPALTGGGDEPNPGSTLIVPTGTLEAYLESNFARLFETVVEQE